MHNYIVDCVGGGTIGRGKYNSIIADDVDLRNQPKEREKEFAGIRIYSDENIEEILKRIEKIEQNITKLKQQISAHDYNIVKKLKE